MQTEPKSPVRSKTLWLNGLAALVGLVAAAAPASPLIASLPSGPVVLSVLGALNVILRFYTKAPLKD